jgi:DNA-binding Xre family transcriptional regulator
MMIYISREKVLQQLERQGMTQTDLAIKMGCTRQAVSSMLIDGVKTLRSLNKMLAHLDCDPRDLIEVRDA